MKAMEYREETIKRTLSNNLSIIQDQLFRLITKGKSLQSDGLIVPEEAVAIINSIANRYHVMVQELKQDNLMLNLVNLDAIALLYKDLFDSFLYLEEKMGEKGQTIIELERLFNKE